MVQSKQSKGIVSSNVCKAHAQAWFYYAVRVCIHILHRYHACMKCVRRYYGHSKRYSFNFLKLPIATNFCPISSEGSSRAMPCCQWNSVDGTQKCLSDRCRSNENCHRSNENGHRSNNLLASCMRPTFLSRHPSTLRSSKCSKFINLNYCTCFCHQARARPSLSDLELTTLISPRPVISIFNFHLSDR